MRGGALFKGKEGRGDFRKNTSKNLAVSQKTLIFADKKEDAIMNTIAIDSNIYKGAES